MKILASNRLYARRYTMEDLDNFYALNGDEEIMRYIRPVKTMEETKEFLSQNILFYDANSQLGRWALISKEKDQFVGTFSLLPLETTNDIHIGYALLKDYWGLGYAAEIVKAGIQYAFSDLGLKSLTAVTYKDNLASQKVLLRNGFYEDGIYAEHGNENLLFRIDFV